MANRYSTGDPAFSTPIAALLGQDVTLPDGTTIQGIYREEWEAGVSMDRNTQWAVRRLEIPPDGLGTLAAEQVINIGGQAYFVVGITRADWGWWLAELRTH